MVLVTGISFQARHYNLGAFATAPQPSRLWWQLQIKVIFDGVVLCAFSGAS
jgi:hypothetical protein